MSLKSMIARVTGRGEDEDGEMNAEMSFHIEEETSRNIRLGMSPDAARSAAIRSFGSVDRFQEEARDVTRARWVEDLLHDVRFSLRMLRRTPVFTSVAVISLALGIGANTAVFSIVRSVLLRDLPYPDADRLTQIYVVPTNTPDARNSLSLADFLGVKGNRTLAAAGAVSRMQGGVALSGMGEAEQVPASLVTSGVFPALGVLPLLGRWILPTDDAPTAVGVAILEYDYWQKRFGGERTVIGRTIQIEGAPTTVIGVMPRGFHIPGIPDDRMWLSNQMSPPQARAPFFLTVFARSAEGATPGSIESDLARSETAVKESWPTSPRQWHYGSAPLKDSLVKTARPTLLLLFGAVALVLLIATANLANLLLTRATTRASELALRASLGAGRTRLIRQLLTESVVIAGLGSACGLVIAFLTVRSVRSIRIQNLPRLDEVTVDSGVLVFTLALALGVGVITGLAPAMRLSRSDLASRLREGSRALGSRGSARLRASLVALEFALALMVAVGAGLLVNSLLRLQRVDSGIGVSELVAIRVSPPFGRYESGPKRVAFYDALKTRIAQIPGVEAVGISMALPPDRLVMRNPFTPQGHTYRAGESAALAEELVVDPGYFSALAIPLLRGRIFSEADRDSAPAVALINETMAVRWFGSAEAAVGRWIQTGDPDPGALKITVVGVVGNVKYSGLDAESAATIYVPFRQADWWPTMYVSMKTDRNATSIMPAVRTALRDTDSNVPIMETLTMNDLRGGAVAAPRFRAVVLGVFALLALLLAAAGIYGVMSYTVAQRQQETSIRIALGASPSDIIGRTVREGMAIATVGIVLGLAGALALARVTSSLLYGIDALDPRTFVMTTVVLGAVGLSASVIPALRASRVDPARAFRGE